MRFPRPQPEPRLPGSVVVLAVALALAAVPGAARGGVTRPPRPVVNALVPAGR